MIYTCKVCNSPELIFEATVEWNEERHDWNVVHVFDNERASCAKCEDSVLVKKEVKR